MEQSVASVSPKDAQHGMLDHRPTLLIFVVLVVAVRLPLALVNRQSNDNHRKVVELIVAGHSMLTMDDCHECFHPKLYYKTCATVLSLFSIESQVGLIQVGQMISVLAGLLTALLLYLGLERPQRAAGYSLIAFALIALNPRLVATNCQLSNDSFAILFSVGASLFTERLLRNPKASTLVIAQCFLCLALMSKGTAWVIPIAISIALPAVACTLPRGKERSLLWVGLAITLVNVPLSIATAGYDFKNYDRYANQAADTRLAFLEESTVGRPGITSVYNSYCTFRFLDLLQHPQTYGGAKINPTHRTSLWTQLYGRANFAQFERHPRSWVTDNPGILDMARITFLFGLVPLFIFLYGVLSVCLLLFRNVLAMRTETKNLWNVREYFSLLICAGYAAFIIKFTADYRDFAAMKVVYILPGIYAFTILFFHGFRTLTDRLTPTWNRAILASVGIVGLCYILGIGALTWQLADRLHNELRESEAQIEVLQN